MKPGRLEEWKVANIDPTSSPPILHTIKITIMVIKNSLAF
jgi:hypothetical protein